LSNRGSPRFDKLAFDPVARLVGPGAEKPPAGALHPVPRPRAWEDDFTRPPTGSSPDVDEAMWLLEYKTVLAQREAAKLTQLRVLLARNLIRPALPTAADYLQLAAEQALQTPPPAGQPEGPFRAPWPVPGANKAIPILALRAARRAVAANPDHPDGYFALARVAADPDLPMTESERALARATALRQCLARFPAPADFERVLRETRGKPYTASATLVAQQLATLLSPQFPPQQAWVPGSQPQVVDADGFLSNELGGVFDRRRVVFFVRTQVRLPDGRTGTQAAPYPLWVPVNRSLDAVRQLLVLASEYAAIEFAPGGTGGAEAEEQRKQLTDTIKDHLKAVEDELRLQNDKFARQGEKMTKAADRFVLARRLELTNKAVEIWRGLTIEEKVKEFGPGTIRALMEVVGLQMSLGKIEDAAADLAELKDAFDGLGQSFGLDEAARDALRRVLRTLDYQKLLLEGDYAGAGAEWEGLFGRNLGVAEVLAALDQLKLDPRPFFDMKVSWQAAALLGTFSPFESLGAYRLYAQYLTFVNARNALAQKLAEDGEFFYRRGYLSLLEGDIPAAKERFKQARRPPIPEWKLALSDAAPGDEYLRMIEAFERRK
jgi:hypothetical protein